MPPCTVKPSTRKIIGICGDPRHGKSTVQGFLQQLGVRPLDDSHQLRLLATQRFDLSWTQVTSQAGKAELIEAFGRTMTVREAIGELGKIDERTYGPNIWVERAIAAFDTKEHAPVSFASIRMGQGHVIKAAGGFVLAVQNPNEPAAIHDFDEWDMDPVDCLIMNDGDLAALRQRTIDAVRVYLNLNFADPRLAPLPKYRESVA